MADVLMTELHIRRLPNGGFVVRDGLTDQGRFCADLFASADLGEALRFISDKLSYNIPAGAQQQRGIGAAPTGYSR